VAILPSFANRDEASDETEAEHSETHGSLKVRKQTDHYGGQCSGHADERAAEKVCGVVEAHGNSMLRMIPFEIVNRTVLSLKSWKSNVPLYG
jgi:hypothetical protein